jgi:hypothetical protein
VSAHNSSIAILNKRNANLNNPPILDEEGDHFSNEYVDMHTPVNNQFTTAKKNSNSNSRDNNYMLNKHKQQEVIKEL